MKRRTKAQQYADIADAVKCIHEGKKVKRSTYKDGSIPTHPVVSVDKVKPEYVVVNECIRWLRKHHIFCNRHDCAGADLGMGQYATYGIKGAGDIIGIIPPDGLHLEIECKAGKGGRLSLGQQKRQINVTNAGGLYFVVHGVEELEHYLGEYLK